MGAAGSLLSMVVWAMRWWQRMVGEVGKMGSALR